MTQLDPLPRNVLFVDDDPSTEKQFEGPLSKNKVTVFGAKDRESALYQFNQRNYDTAIVSYSFAGQPGLSYIQKWRQDENTAKQICGFIITISKPLSPEEESLISEIGFIEVLRKPLNIATLLGALGKANQNRRQLEALIELKTQTLSYLEKGGNFDKAIELVRSKLDILGARGVELLASLFEKADRNEEALGLVTSMLEKRGSDLRLLSTKGRLLMRMGKLEEARPFLEKADSLAPANLDRIASLGQLYMEMKDGDRAQSKFKQLVTIAPMDTAEKMDVIQGLLGRGFNTQAQTLCEETTLPTEVMRHFNNIGVMHSKDGHFQKAVTNYQNALQLIPKSKDVHKIYFNLALAFLKSDPKNMKHMAEEFLKKALLKKPTYSAAQTLLQRLQEGATNVTQQKEDE